MAECCPREKYLKDDEVKRSYAHITSSLEGLAKSENDLKELFIRVAKLEAAACQCTCGKC